MDALWAAVGEDSLTEIQPVLLPRPAQRPPQPEPPGRRRNPQAAADALIGAFTKHYQCDHPDDAEVLKRIGPVQGDALVNLVRAGAVNPQTLSQ
jgi:hypothetical protein